MLLLLRGGKTFGNLIDKVGIAVRPATGGMNIEHFQGFILSYIAVIEETLSSCAKLQAATTYEYRWMSVTAMLPPKQTSTSEPGSRRR
jgi:hypothetical protein